MEKFYGTGRRKRSIARVYLSPGTGKIQINRQDMETYFPRLLLQKRVLAPLELVEKMTTIDILAFVKGGGKAGQADATKLGIARALVESDQELRPPLKKAMLLSRDTRVVERKKYGQKGARARFQYSKR